MASLFFIRPHSFLYAYTNTNVSRTIAANHESGYEINIVLNVLWYGKYVNTNISLTPHTQAMEIIIEENEYPMPLKTPVKVSIIPQRKYVAHII